MFFVPWPYLDSPYKLSATFSEQDYTLQIAGTDGVDSLLLVTWYSIIEKPLFGFFPVLMCQCFLVFFFTSSFITFARDLFFIGQLSIM